MNQKDKESLWDGHNNLYATMGCVWVHVERVVSWLCILHPRQGICVTSVQWVGKSCSIPRRKAVPGVDPTPVTPWGCLSQVLSNSHSLRLNGNCRF